MQPTDSPSPCRQPVPGTRRAVLGAAAQLACTVAVAPAAVALAACASGGPAAPATGPESLSGKVAWLVRNTSFEVEWGNRIVVPEMARLYPQLSVELVNVPGGADLDAKLTAMTVGGSSPDVWSHWGGRSYVDYVHNGWLDDLPPLVKRDKLDAGSFLPNT